MESLLQRVERTINRHDMVESGMRLGVAVSGGADSLCLLHILLELAPRWNLHLHVLHMNHGLRGSESQGDAEFVRHLAERLKLPVTMRDVDLTTSKDNLEQAARHARLAYFEEMMRDETVDRVATGHTKSDQAETVLFRFLRGAGTAGLSGIRPSTATGIIRPLLDLDRADVEHFLRDRQIAWRDDSTNCSKRFARNRIRHDLLPQLERDWNPAIVDSLAQTADWAAAEEAWWEAEIDRLSGCLREQDGTVVANRNAIIELPLAIARRLVRRAIERVKGNLRKIDFSHIQAVLEMAAGPRGHGRVQLPGVEVLRSFDWLRFAVPGIRIDPYSLKVDVPGIVQVPAAGLAFHMELIEKSEPSNHYDCVYNSEMGCVNWARLTGPLAMRNWRPGDRYQPVNSGGSLKLKTLFQEVRVPLWERRSWPVLTDGSAIVWARRFGPAAGYAPVNCSGAILRITEVEPA